MFRLLGTIIFGVGTSLNAKVITDRIVYGKKDPNHMRMTVLGFIFMVLGEGLRQIEQSPSENVSIEEV